MTRLHAVRVAARLRSELDVDVEVVGGPYGQFQVRVDGALVLEGGPMAMLGILPSVQEVLDVVREAVSDRQPRNPAPPVLTPR